MDDPDVDRLYALPLEDFVAERDALARERRGAGDRAGAQAIKALPKPTRAAWAVNRLARTRGEEIAALVQAGEALEGAQARLLAGDEDAAALRAAAEAARALVDALAEEAEVGGPAAREKVRATLHAATVDPDVRREVAAGRVVRERSAAGFGRIEAAGTSTATATPRRSSATGAARGARPAPQDGDRRERAERRERERRALRRRDAVRRAREAEAAAEADVDGARRALAQVEATLAARRADLEAAEAVLSEARARREKAERQAAQEG